MNKLEELAHKYAEVYDNGNMFCWEIILAALREWTEVLAKRAAAEWGRNGGAEHDLTAAVAAIRAMAEEEV